MGWRYFGLIAVLSSSFGGGFWMGGANESRVCQIDLRRDAREMIQRLVNDKAFSKLPDGTLATDQECRLRLAHEDGAALDHVFSWAALVRGSGSDADGLSIMLKTDEMPAGEVYEQALDFLVGLIFSNEAVDRLEGWYRETRRGQGSTAALEIVKATHQPMVTLAITRGTLDEGAWRVVLEIRP